MKNCNEIMRGERAELSKKNPYYISKHRYYELKHFCRQYDEWKRALVRIDGWKAFPESTGAIVNATPSNPTEQMAMARAFYSSRVYLLEHCLGELEPAIAPYILRGVTEGHSYEALRIKGCHAARILTTTTIANFSGFSAGSGHDAKNSAAFMKGGMLICLT